MTTFKALRVEETENEAGEKQFSAAVVMRDIDELPAGDVLIKVEYSSLNYKDALSASGNKGVTREYPHTPGIDAAGTVVASSADQFQAGESVIVIGYDLGMNTDGGFGQYIRVPAGWVVHCPQGLSARDSMIIGTAGFTAALCVEKLLLNGVVPEKGPVLVTGATGGVGVFAVALLHKLGFEVVASSGKPESAEMLKSLGASAVIDRNTLSEENPRPLLKEQWAAAVDAVGGETLSNVLKSIRYGGSVACCGLVQSPAFKATVLPFILRGVNLLGVDSVQLPLDVKAALWSRLAGEWKLEKLDLMATEIGFEQLETALQTVLQGKATGRYLLALDS